MQSRLLIEYLRTGTIPPLEKGDTKGEVEAKLGLPGDWKGRQRDFAWSGSPLTNPHDSWAWHYGSLCVTFDNPCYPRLLPGVSLNYHYAGIGTPVFFSPPFSELPQALFTLRDVIELMRDREIQFQDYRDNREREAILVSEGGIGITTRAWNVSPKAQVNHLFPCKYEAD